MGLDYDWYLAGVKEPHELASEMVGLNGFKVERDSFEGPGVMGKILRVDKLGRSLLRESLNMEPDLMVGFRIDLGQYSEESGYTGVDTVIRACLDLQERLPGNAVLLFNGESTIWTRIGGLLVLNRAKGFWIQERLSLVKVPYKFEELPSL